MGGPLGAEEGEVCGEKCWERGAHGYGCWGLEGEWLIGGKGDGEIHTETEGCKTGCWEHGEWSGLQGCARHGLLCPA